MKYGPDSSHVVFVTSLVMPSLLVYLVLIVFTENWCSYMQKHFVLCCWKNISRFLQFYLHTAVIQRLYHFHGWKDYNELWFMTSWFFTNFFENCDQSLSNKGLFLWCLMVAEYKISYLRYCFQLTRPLWEKHWWKYLDTTCILTSKMIQSRKYKKREKNVLLWLGVF
jgi:hypothetical protein